MYIVEWLYRNKRFTEALLLELALSGESHA